MCIPNPYGIETVSIYTDTDRDHRQRHRQDTNPETEKDLDCAPRNGTDGAVGRKGLWKKEGVISVKDAAYRANKSPDTIARWCQRYGIGKQLHLNAPWRVDPVGLAIVIAGDADALLAYRSGDQDSIAITPYQKPFRLDWR
jgi:hypothetical protein